MESGTRTEVQKEASRQNGKSSCGRASDAGKAQSPLAWRSRITVEPSPLPPAYSSTPAVVPSSASISSIVGRVPLNSSGSLSKWVNSATPSGP